MKKNSKKYYVKTVWCNPCTEEKTIYIEAICYTYKKALEKLEAIDNYYFSLYNSCGHYEDLLKIYIEEVIK